MAKTDDRESQYVFVEDEDIFAEDEKRLAARNSNLNLVPVSKNEVNTIKPTPRIRHDVKVTQDASKLHRAVKLLSSVPPPPSTTNPQFTLTNILEIWHSKNNFEELRSKWSPGLSEEKLGHDVYLNSNKYVEELEHLRLNLQDRFVSNETTSHFSSTIPSTLTEQDRQLQKRNGWLKSPASRVNYLSQRKIIFSTFSNNVRTFTVDNSKKPTFLKSNVESKVCSKSHVPKRALFQSPEKQYSGVASHSNYSISSGSYSSMPPSNYSVPSSASTASSSSSNSLITPSRSILSKWVASRGESRQASSTPRSREPSFKRNCSKSLSFDDQLHADKKDKSVKKPKKLSQLHCKKMLWAVETLLKSEGVLSSDPEYKEIYSNVYRETTHVWLKYYENEPRGSVSGTSDLMVKVAKKILPGIEQKLGLSCSAIKARKHVIKKIPEPSTVPLRNDGMTPLQLDKSSSLNDSWNGSSLTATHPANQTTCTQDEEIVFSPEILGVSNLCDDINAVISSLDNLPPDPGDPKTSGQNLVSTLSKCENDLSVPEQIRTEDLIVSSSSTSLLQSDKSSLLVVPNSETNVSALSKSVDDSITSNVSISQCPVEISVCSQTKSDCPEERILTPVDSGLEGKISLEPAVLSASCIDPVPTSTEPSQPETDRPFPNNDSSEIVHNSSNDKSICDNSATVPNCVENINIDVASTMNCPSSKESTTSVEPVKTIHLPVCVVKLEKCHQLVALSENVKTPDLLYSSKLRNRSSSKSSVTSEILQNSDGNIEVTGPIINEDAETPGSSNSDAKRSKRKRSSDSNSCENTPVSTNSKRRSSKRLCFEEAELSVATAEPSLSVRRSSRNKVLPGSDDQSSISIAHKRLIFSKEGNEKTRLCSEFNKSVEELSNVTGHSSNSDLNIGRCGSSNIVENGSDSNNANLKEDETTVSLIQEGESSTSDTRVGSGNAFDKENDSSIENYISDVETQNWSPVLKLKRSSKNLWSSELKKKRISSRRKKDDAENSPVSSPFLDLEGPFKYRLCKRALPGDFISAVIKGKAYSTSIKNLVRNKSITEDCVLVRSVKEGVELRIPLELFKREKVVLGPHKLYNMMSDVIEDAVSRLEEDENSDSEFLGFTPRQVNQAILTSCKMDQILKIIESTHQMVKPLFTMYKYAIVKKSPAKVQQFYQIIVEILKTSLFLMKTSVDDETIQVKPMKSESPKKIQLEINIPVNLIANNYSLEQTILKDLSPIHNIISC